MFRIREIEDPQGKLPPCPEARLEQLNAENDERTRRAQINYARAERESHRTPMPQSGYLTHPDGPLNSYVYLVVGIVAFIMLFGCALLVMIKAG